MNFRNKYLVNTIRIILGLFLIFSGVAGFMAGADMKNIPPAMVETSKVLWQTGIFQFIKTTEIIAGIMLAIGFLPALALLSVAPIGLGVIIFNSQVSPANLPFGIVFCLFIAYLGYAYWDKYKQLFERKK